MSETLPGETHSSEREPGPQKRRSLARLVLGALIEGTDVLFSQLRHWEQDLADQPGLQQVAPGTSEPLRAENDPLPEHLSPPEQPIASQQAHASSNQPGFAESLVGLAYTGAERWSSTRRQIQTRWRSSEHHLLCGLQSFFRPVRRLPGYRPVERRLDRLVARGEMEVQRWSQRGAVEIAHSRQLARRAVEATTQAAIDSLTENPEIRELVQTQGIGLAAEVVEEVRERTVSADTLVEGVVRSLLRRLPRRDLPPPPPEVRARAERIHPPEKKS
ncbi:MAG: hypothetical protein JW862_12020 [Anaerolineales bacterium]|nr:hypothetical protein [Anaerolineales bacterium]